MKSINFRRIFEWNCPECGAENRRALIKAATHIQCNKCDRKFMLVNEDRNMQTNFNVTFKYKDM